MFLKQFSFLILLNIPMALFSQKKYVENKNNEGKLISSGWIQNNLKVDYWKFYNTENNIISKGHYKNGIQEGYWYFYFDNKTLKKEGHYRNGLQTDWWIFYDEKGNLTCKMEYSQNQKNGFCLRYQNNTIVKVEKYKNDSLIQEWNSLKEFKKDNNLSNFI